MLSFIGNVLAFLLMFWFFVGAFVLASYSTKASNEVSKRGMPNAAWLIRFYGFMFGAVMLVLSLDAMIEIVTDYSIIKQEHHGEQGN